MANADKPRGFWPIRTLTGGEIRTERFRVNDSTDTALFKGDLVAFEATGNIDAAAADAGVIVCGVLESVEYTDANGKRVYDHYIPADPITAGYSDIWANVWANPYIVFGVQADTGTALAEATTLNATANHVAGTGNTTTKLSGHELDSDNVGTGGQLGIIGIVDRPDNVWGENVDLEVVIKEHYFNAAVAGV